MNTIGFIPARSGSERLPGKNGLRIRGRTLVERAVDVALACGLRPVVSTDDPSLSPPEYYLARPVHLARHTSQIEPSIRHALAYYPQAERVVLLQPTSPFRRASTVRACLDALDRGYDSATTVTLDHRNCTRLRSWEDGTLRPLWNRPVASRPRSQDSRSTAVENGVAWAFTREHWDRTHLRQGGREALILTSWVEAIEIDTPEDFRAVTFLSLDDSLLGP